MSENGRVMYLTEGDFEEQVIASPIPVLVDFWAPWCGPCRSIAPILEELAAEYGEKLKIAKLNVDEGPRWTTRFGIHGIPTLLFFKDGAAQGRLVGAVSKREMRSFVGELL